MVATAAIPEDDCTCVTNDSNRPKSEQQPGPSAPASPNEPAENNMPAAQPSANGGDIAATALEKVKKTPSRATAADWRQIGVEVDEELSKSNRATMLANFAVPTISLSSGERSSLGAIELQFIADIVMRAAPTIDNYKIVTAEFGSTPVAWILSDDLKAYTRVTLLLGVDTSGDGSIDRTVNFQISNDDYRPLSAVFDDYLRDRSAEKMQSYQYIGNDLAWTNHFNSIGQLLSTERDTDGDGTLNIWGFPRSDCDSWGDVEFEMEAVESGVAALENINAGTATLGDFQIAGIDLRELASGWSRGSLDRLGKFISTAKGLASELYDRSPIPRISDEPLEFYMVQQVASVFHYYETLGAAWEIDPLGQSVAAIIPDSDGTNSYRYEMLENITQEIEPLDSGFQFSVDYGKSATPPSQQNAE